MKKLLFLLMIILLSTPSFAQLLNFSQEPIVIPEGSALITKQTDWDKALNKIDDFNNNLKNNTNFFINKKGEKVENINVIGDMYLSSNFKKAKVIYKKTGEVINLFVRYRIFDDSFEARKAAEDENTLIMERSNQFDVKYDDRHFVFINKLPVFINEANNGYVLVMAENDKVSLVKRISQKYVPGQKARSAMESNKKPRLLNNENYFIAIDNKLTEIEPHKRKAYKAFPDHQKELKQFIKKDNLKFKESSRDEDLNKLVNYYGNL
ncbi:hypothetical protein ACFQ3R_12845 [Mesonia ostreae]|uniref:Uncharacterized protein n=1 Tax=Mesonia ostreae TaxID=861110 RepID=A0ABU2KFK0_9FLAO|nr:hypothetical protein [Mesonia ostreae]MDT0293473.1 hypothetical protein [Mesonia ostreae]